MDKLTRAEKRLSGICLMCDEPVISLYSRGKRLSGQLAVDANSLCLNHFNVGTIDNNGAYKKFEVKWYNG